MSKCETIDEFHILYEKGGAVGDSLERLYKSSDGRGIDIASFSSSWAEDLFLNRPSAEVLECDRSLGMHFIFRLIEQWEKGKVTTGNLTVGASKDIAYEVLRFCLPMTRDRVLYYKTAAGSSIHGTDWFAKRDVEENKEWENRWATIDEKLIKFIESDELKLKSTYAEYLKPRRTPRKALQHD